MTYPDLISYEAIAKENENLTAQLAAALEREADLQRRYDRVIDHLAEVAVERNVLREAVEWVPLETTGPRYYCPWCSGADGIHKATCIRQRALATGEEEKP